MRLPSGASHPYFRKTLPKGTRITVAGIHLSTKVSTEVTHGTFPKIRRVLSVEAGGELHYQGRPVILEERSFPPTNGWAKAMRDTFHYLRDSKRPRFRPLRVSDIARAFAEDRSIQMLATELDPRTHAVEGWRTAKDPSKLLRDQFRPNGKATIVYTNNSRKKVPIEDVVKRPAKATSVLIHGDLKLRGDRKWAKHKTLHLRSNGAIDYALKFMYVLADRPSKARR